MHLVKKGLVLAGAIALGAVLSPTVAGALGNHNARHDGQASSTVGAHPAVASGKCHVTQVNYAASDLTGSTTASTAFVDIPEAQVTFRQGGTKVGCAIVTFSGESYAANTPGELMYVRAALTDGTVAAPS